MTTTRVVSYLVLLCLCINTATSVSLAELFESATLDIDVDDDAKDEDPHEKPRLVSDPYDDGTPPYIPIDDDKPRHISTKPEHEDDPYQDDKPGHISTKHEDGPDHDDKPVPILIKPGHEDDPDHDYKPTYKRRKVPKCRPELSFLFDDPKRPFQERKNRIYAQGVGKIRVSDGAANFFGQGFIKIPFFKENDLRPGYRILFTFTPKSIDGPPQSIFSNSLFKEYATLTLSLEGDKLVLTIVERPADNYAYVEEYGRNVVQLSVEIDTDDENHILIQQNDEVVILTSDGDEAKAYSRLPAITKEPLYIGAGSSAVKKLYTFKGSIGEFKFSKCPHVPRYVFD